MELNERAVVAHTEYTGSANVSIGAGRRFIIETSPGGEDVLGETVPEGKQWVVTISLKVIETDV